MNLLLSIDPIASSIDMKLNRVPTFQKMALSLAQSGHHLTVYGSSDLKPHFHAISDKVIFLPASHEFLNFAKNTDFNNALLYINQAPDELEYLLRADLNSIDQIPDVLISTAPTTLFRKIWSKPLFLHYELGFFNRAPFPIYHQFDPSGFHHKSLLSKYPLLNLPVNNEALIKMDVMRMNFLSQLGISNSQIGHWDVIYVPLPSYKNWTVKSEISYSNRIQYLIDYANSNPDKTIVTNEKPQYPLSVDERISISTVSNIRLIENTDSNGIGSLLSLICKTTYSFSPSISLQTIFWGNKLITHPDSSILSWAKHIEAREQLAGYIDIFNILDFGDINSRIDIWGTFNPYA